eukprot:scaffold162_cov267-Chaetoceros_neogracile.AAC.23
MNQTISTSIDQVEFDFEDYALTYGIPDTVDPLPYRKAGSVFATGDEAEPQVTSAKNDPRLRTVVCRHWLRDLCMKGAACEFLHQYDLSKMPLCRHGDKCKIRDCPFRHISEADRLECVFYSQGFCIHGPFCRYKHVRRDRIDLPVVADFTLGLSQMQAGKDGITPRRPAPKPNEFFKISLCKHFMQGECPFGDGCHFAHGEHELKKFPKKGEPGKTEGEGEEAELSENMFGNQESTTVDYYRGGSVGTGDGKPTPILEPESAAFFICRASTQKALAVSTVRKEWCVQRKHAEKMNSAFHGGKQVMVFFHVSGSDHIQGAALMTSMATYQETMDIKGEQDSFCYKFKCEWYRTTELPVSTAVKAAPNLILPTTQTQLCEDMTCQTGEAVMKALWNSPIVTLYESCTGEKEPPKDEEALIDFRCSPSNEPSWPVMPGPGFIFGCNSQTMDECLGRGIFGLPAHMKHVASGIKPGSSIFLYNVTDRLIFGIFEAVTPATLNIEPRAFSKNPKATSSPFPVQIRVRVSLECPPLEDTDPLVNDILRTRVGGRIGPLTNAQSEALATLLAVQCGAMEFMNQYSTEATNGNRNAQTPPIAMPPKKQRKQ